MTEKKEETLNYKKVTLAELSNNLPIIRRTVDGKPIEKRNFSFIEWDMTIEEKLSDLKQKAKSMGEYVTNMLNMLLADFCGQDFQKLSKEEKILALSQLEYSNIIYMYVYLRVEELGDELRLDVQCPHCLKMNKDFVCSLNDMDVHVKDAEHARTVDYDLKKPITIDEKIVTGLKLDIAKWEAMEKADPDQSDNSAKVKQLIFNSSIAGAYVEDGKPFPGYADIGRIVKGMKKIDIERLSGVITKNNCGPAMMVKGDCVHCRKEWFKELNWSYDYFFANSSL